eukprot:CAMPEP_0174701046 /NCGR_PEP_ID=MMETSP1094-20130205/5811_1 /TAXON_ID=156173 /ORGANISM="Chrysochromulina brevifilum, Strain UTEX LB 985" /LENGTH=115 /DNA_ID=CAMNT_0015898631 /DNA_START=723 /DNA_END=1070 /DNA_ORIENTATION=+
MATTLEPTATFVNACMQRQAAEGAITPEGRNLPALPYNEHVCKELHLSTFGEILEILALPHQLLTLYGVDGGPDQSFFLFLRDNTIEYSTSLFQGCYVALLRAAWSDGDLVTSCM